MFGLLQDNNNTHFISHMHFDKLVPYAAIR